MSSSTHFDRPEEDLLGEVKDFYRITLGEAEPAPALDRQHNNISARSPRKGRGFYGRN